MINNILHPMDDRYPYIDTLIRSYRSDITNLKIENNTLRITACKTGFMSDELEPHSCYYNYGHRVCAKNIYVDSDKRTHRQRAEDLLTYSELRKLATKINKFSV